MASLYKGVYKAVYDYEANTPEELSLSTGDLLYILEISDVDDWWTVKKRTLPVSGEDVEEPVGLIPSNYIEKAPVVSKCTTLYDYDKQTEEELSFKEGELFEIYDMNDPDWLLAGNSTEYGFIPSNYIQYQSAGPAANPSNLGVSGTSAKSSVSPKPTDFAPPPVHKDLLNKAVPSVQEPKLYDLDGENDKFVDANDGTAESEDEAPPPMPTRPAAGPVEREAPVLAEKEEYLGSQTANGSASQEHGFDGEYFRWFIDEVDGRKKRPVVLAIGNGLIILKPNSNNPKKLLLKSASSLDNNWRIRDLVNYNHEKKHVFFDFKNPTASLELHAGTKDVADAIVAVLGDLKGAEEARGLKEVARAALTKTSTSNKRVGKLLFDFKAQSKDELLCREGDEVYVVDSKKSKEWWLCERTSDGRQGVIPSTYVQIIATTNLDKLTDGVQRRKSQKASPLKGRVVESGKHRYRDRDDRDRIRESDRKKRSEPAKSGQDMPNFHRIRTWIDSSGSFKVEAEFLGFKEDKIHLHKTNGVKIAVQATKLSVEDLEYVEKVTDIPLDKYKEEVMRQTAKREKAKSKSKSATAVINDLPPPKPDRSKATPIPLSEPDYDWFEFFLSCGVDIGNCQRYSVNFSKEQMDESILEDITPSLLRSLGLREGDILRVMKHLDHKFKREKSAAPETPAGGLFTEPTGALKNNSTTELSKVSANALPVPAKDLKSEDDAWAIKPALRGKEEAKPAQYTGSLQDLVDIEPLDGKSLSIVTAPLTPVKTGNSQKNKPLPAVQPQVTAQVPQATAQTQSLHAQPTLGMTPMRTGGLVPVPTGGLIPVQPTGFIPIPAQPTGFIPIQATSGLMPQPTYVVQLQTGVSTFQVPQTSFNQANSATLNQGNPPTTFNQPALFLQATVNQIPMQPTSFNQVPLQPTASFVPLQAGTAATMPQTSFGTQMTGGNQTLFGGQATGGNLPQTSFGAQMTGGHSQTSFGNYGTTFTGQHTGQSVYGQSQMPAQQTGGIANAFVPQSTFGKQITGGFMAQNPTGGAQSVFSGAPQNSFGGQATGGMMPQTSFGAQMTGGNQGNQFGTFGNQTGNQAFGNQTGNQSFGQMPPQTSFGTQVTGGFGNSQFGNSAGQFGNQMNQMTNMFQNTSIQPSLGQPATSFGQQFEGFGSQPLDSQPTGLGFGNGPLQSQPTGKRANLQAATADNPFGF